MSKILITGATGHLGTATIEHLLNHTPADNIVALARDSNKAQPLIEKGIEVRIGNFDDTDSLENAAQGIEKVLLISGLDAHRLQQHKNVVDAAKKADVKYIAYTGVALTDVSASAVRPFMEDHFKTEEYIKENGFTYTFLRNTLYADAIAMFAGENAVETGVYLPAGNGKVPFALRKDLAEATANVLAQNGHENKIYNLTGGDLYSFGDVAQILSELLGQTVSYTDADEKEYAETLKKLGVPEIGIFINSGFSSDIKNKLYEIESGDLETLLGRKPVELRTVLKSLYNL